MAKRLRPPPPARDASGDRYAKDYQSILKLEGVVVVPTPLTEQAPRTATVQAFLQSIRESPEFNNPAPEDITWKPQLGGFAAMANPSAFHHPFARKLREMLTAAILDMDALPLEGRKLEKPFDRMLYRIPGETPTAESMHRDESPNAAEGDDIFGGWVNLDDQPQYFSCCPRTHQEVGNQNKGFAKITDKEEKATYRSQFRRIQIPPGCCVIFYERLVHEVVAIKATYTMYRMFLGWRATNADEPLFGNETTMGWINDQAVPKIKSGQDPPVWPSAYSNFPSNFETLTKWSRRTFVPECLYTHTVGGDGAAAGTKWIRVKAKMLSLRAYGLPMWPAYDRAEASLMGPQREWQLYTFDSPEARLTFSAPSPDDWEAFVRAQHSVPLGTTAMRPRPERDLVSV